MQGITDQPLSKDGYAPTMMAYTGPGGPVAPAAAAPMPAPAPQPSPPSGPIPQPFTHSAAAAEQTVGQAAGQVGQAANQAAKELEKGFGSIGAGDMFGSKPAPAGAAAQGGAGPAGQVRNSTVWWLLGLVTCGLTTWFWLWKSASEMKAFTGNTEINPIIPVAIQFFFPPWGQLFFAYKMGGWMMQARQSVGLPAEDKSKKWAIWTFILFLSQKQIQDDMNELWEAVGGGA